VVNGSYCNSKTDPLSDLILPFGGLFWHSPLHIKCCWSYCYSRLISNFNTKSKSNARQLLLFIDPSLGVPLPEKNYSSNCELTFQNVWEQLDIFIWAHTIGWIAKALILRDYWLCWVISILFEIMEYTLAHQLPNFGECWWDHWVLDVLLTNWLGIYIGMKLCEYFAMKVV
jgi:phosphatidylserine synthase 2